MDILQDQFRKVQSFFVILILLFAVNALFNLNFTWSGVSVIVRVYIMVFSFLIVFNFSQVDLVSLNERYRKKFGTSGVVYLFFFTRIIPFVLIYLMTSIFTIISYIQSAHWPLDPFFKLMDGRFSNTLIYSLILLLILKQNRKPHIAIPQFIIYSAIFLILDKSLYDILSPGYGIGGIKFGKYILFSFFIIFEFLYNRKSFFKSLAVSITSGVFLFSAVAGAAALIFEFADKNSYAYNSSARLLLKSGVSLPLHELENVMVNKNGKYDVDEILHYSREYGKSLNYSLQEWENFLISADTGSSSGIIEYLTGERIMVNFNVLSGYVLSASEIDRENFSRAVSLQKYYALYFNDNSKKFFHQYNSGNRILKIWIIESLAYTERDESVPFLLQILTGIDRRISEKAYDSLAALTGLDPAADLNCSRFDVKVILKFREYLRDRKVH